MVAAAGLVGRLGQLQLAVEQRFDGAAGGLGHGAGQRCRVVGASSPADGGLAQQLGAGALPQGSVVQPSCG
jgi:hypothetical protein